MFKEWNDGRNGGAGPAALSRRQQLLEVAVFLFLILPSMLLSFLALVPDGVGFTTVAVTNILRDLSLLALVLYLLWRNGEPLQSIGWTLKNGWREAALGVWLFIPIYLAITLLGALLRQAGLSGPEEPLPFLMPHGAGEFLLALVFLVVVAVSEETIFRGYLIRRFSALTASPFLAAVLSTLIFSVGHTYQGSAGVVAVGILGLLFALVYLWRGSLIAPMVMHFIQNFIGVILVPALEPG